MQNYQFCKTLFLKLNAMARKSRESQSPILKAVIWMDVCQTKPVTFSVKKGLISIFSRYLLNSPTGPAKLRQHTGSFCFGTEKSML